MVWLCVALSERAEDWELPPSPKKKKAKRSKKIEVEEAPENSVVRDYRRVFKAGGGF